MNKKTWQEVFKAPFKIDDRSVFIFDSDNRRVMQFHRELEKEVSQAVEDILNGKKIQPLKRIFQVRDEDVYMDDELVFCVRGWGFLTKVLQLTSAEAIEIQDDLLRFVSYRLNGVVE